MTKKQEKTQAEAFEETLEDNVKDKTEPLEKEPEKEKEKEPAPQDEKLSQLNDKLLRITAEYENYRKRTQREKETLYEAAKADTIAAFLPLFDNIEKAVALKPSGDGEWKAFSEGVDLMRKQMADILTGLGVEAIDALGEVFDPELHNAVMHIEDEASGEGVIVSEFQKGFRINDRVIRHSVVKVAN